LMLTGLLHAYQAIKDDNLTDMINQNANFLRESMIIDDILIRSFGSKNEGYLEDYAAVIQAFITYYETFGDEKYLMTAKKLADHVINNFYDENELLFYYTSEKSEKLIARKKELFDNVIPSSNALMAENLWKLGVIFFDAKYKNMASKMVDQVSHLIGKEPEYMSYWSLVAINMMNSTAEIMIIGSDYSQFLDSINKKFIPSKICLATEFSSELELFNHKTILHNQTTVYLCHGKTCKRPVFSAQEALDLMKE
ncbi:MAG: thioredoxin domain-containing protein, partial [Cyclobacteriaceae bacterium]